MCTFQLSESIYNIHILKTSFLQSLNEGILQITRALIRSQHLNKQCEDQRQEESNTGTQFAISINLVQ